MDSLSKAWLFTADISTLINDGSLAAAAEGMVSDERRAAARRISNIEGRCRSLGAEILLRAGMEKSGVCPSKYCGLTFEYRKNGKPYLQGSEEVFFNISHSGDMVICALAPFEVGCDIEEIRQGSRTGKIASRYFTEEEQAFINSCEEQTRAFYRMWTLKESFMKVTGLGLALPLTDFCISIREEDVCGAEDAGITVSQSVDDRHYSFYEFSEIPGYAVSVCEADGSIRPVITEISLEEYIQTKQNIL